ncbi:MAG: hypothetical protein A3E01_09460 [Gammaproteobacteria bacterium RIFCSPHIGHO2_12_FULL_63_22]|nr:MAG: hypothetical protein A3E01_09460 [Gammaproteobacteria bacterium RIFCSPHIGHO2_12_FULL_63_22]
MDRSWILRIVLAAALALPAMSVMAAGVGLVKTSKGSVTILRNGKQLPAPVGTSIEAADTIVTGKDGSAGITFVDNSRMALGPGSRLAIDRFDFDQKTHEGRFDSTLKRGTLSAVSGKLAKHSPKAMTVRTRSTILAVRGTEFLVSTR